MYKQSYLLGRHVEGDSPEVHLLVGVDAGQDKEDAGPLEMSHRSHDSENLIIVQC